MIPFTKMHGLGNDFVVIDNRDETLHLSDQTRRLLADRRWGIGCDQLLILEPVTDRGRQGDASAFMRIYNPDGSEARACGNGTRCVAALLMEEMSTEHIILETVAGILPVIYRGGGQYAVTMGVPRFDWASIPLASPCDTLHLNFEYAGVSDPAVVNIGNPHCIFFVEEAEAIPLSDIGPKIEHHPLFPERINVEFASPRPQGGFRMRVWERGAGITQACGSGACAVAVAAIRRGLVSSFSVPVQLDGGELQIEWSQSDIRDTTMSGVSELEASEPETDEQTIVAPVTMIGPVTLVFQGHFNDDAMTKI